VTCPLEQGLPYQLANVNGQLMNIHPITDTTTLGPIRGYDFLVYLFILETKGYDFPPILRQPWMGGDWVDSPCTLTLPLARSLSCVLQTALACKLVHAKPHRCSSDWTAFSRAWDAQYIRGAL
jgi:hypothetical protein